MLIEPRYRECVCLLVLHEPGPLDAGQCEYASAALISRPVTTCGSTSFFAVYVLTSALVIEDARRRGGLRVRFLDGEQQREVITDVENDWFILDGTGIAIGVVPMPESLETIIAVPAHACLPDGYAPHSGAHPIAEGDEVFISSVFLPGGRNIIPAHKVVRFGQIALALTDVPVNNEGASLKAYLAEIRSWGGHRGSPVFAFFPSYREPGSVIIGDPFIGLLGVIYDHYQLEESVTLDRGDEAAQVSVSAGMAAVTPISHAIPELIQGQLIRPARDALAEQLQNNVDTIFPGARVADPSTNHAVFVREPHWQPSEGRYQSFPYPPEMQIPQREWHLKIR